ncbi:hypothetical protein [Woodsholea maritima]|uniref:hypothetical protein n=1 Tax=Woodsholea maritima TaxID=240237 RepID=UPI00037A6236|nr:hypothetical protein [Woodsholea maritima]
MDPVYTASLGASVVVTLILGIGVGRYWTTYLRRDEREDTSALSPQALKTAIQKDAQVLSSLPTRLRAQVALEAFGAQIENRPLAFHTASALQGLSGQNDARTRFIEKHGGNHWTPPKTLKAAGGGAQS